MGLSCGVQETGTALSIARITKLYEIRKKSTYSEGGREARFRYNTYILRIVYTSYVSSRRTWFPWENSVLVGARIVL